MEQVKPDSTLHTHARDRTEMDDDFYIQYTLCREKSLSANSAIYNIEITLQSIL